MYLSGGTTGPVLDGLVRASGIQSLRISIPDHTRISHTVHERSSGLEFRFVPKDRSWSPRNGRRALRPWRGSTATICWQAAAFRAECPPTSM